MAETRSAPSSYRLRKVLQGTLIYALLLTLAGAFIAPFLWQLSTALKAPAEVMRIPIQWIPARIQWSNFRVAWSSAPFTTYAINSTIVTTLNVLAEIFVCSFVAYGFAKIRFPGRDVLFLLVLATMMIPFHVRSVPLYLIFNKVGWNDTLKPLIIPPFFGGNVVAVFLFRQFFRGLPDELDEAAEIDGCNPLLTFWKITMPLSMPAVATVAIFAFIGSWNNLWEPLIYLTSKSKFTLPLGLKFFVSEFAVLYHLLMAASIITILPCIVVFFTFQRYFVKGVALTGIKG
jgi:multiple sugar transport system permease protein